MSGRPGSRLWVEIMFEVAIDLHAPIPVDPIITTALELKSELFFRVTTECSGNECLVGKKTGHSHDDLTRFSVGEGIKSSRSLCGFFLPPSSSSFGTKVAVFAIFFFSFPACRVGPAGLPCPGGILLQTSAGSGRTAATPAGHGRAAETPAGSGGTAETPAGSGRTAETPAGSGRTAETPAGHGRTAETPAGSGRTAEMPAENKRTAEASAGSERTTEMPAGPGQPGPGQGLLGLGGHGRRPEEALLPRTVGWKCNQYTV